MPRKVGRPTDNPKTIKLQIRVSEETMNDIDFCAQKLQTNRSEIVRKGIALVKDQIKK